MKLFYSICALGCRICSDENIRLLEPRLSSTAKRLCQLTIADVSLESIQTCVLIANICGVEADSSSEALCFGKYRYSLMRVFQVLSAGRHCNAHGIHDASQHHRSHRQHH